MAAVKDTIVRNIIDLENDWGAEVQPDRAISLRWVNAMKRGRILFYDAIVVDTGLKDIDLTGGHVKLYTNKLLKISKR